jgi:hypothetical protein
MKTIASAVNFALAVGLLLAATSGNAQKELAPAKTQPNQFVPSDCEGNDSTLNVTHQTAAALGPDGIIIAIARLGDGERNRMLNYRRLHNARVYLTEIWHRKPESVITAEGDRVKGYGRTELYVGGKLFDVIAVKPNQDLLVGSCEPEDIRPKWIDRNLYPYLGQKPRKALIKR